jgi:urease accessory protein
MNARGWLLALAWVPTLVFAHEESGQAAGLLAGLVHPVSGFDHVLAMVAVGLWGAVLGPPAIWVLPVAFPLVMACGGLLGLLGVPLPGVELGIALSAVALGAMVLAELRPPLWIAALIVAFFAVFHGHAHGRELPEGTSALLYSLGFVVATGLLHAVGILLGIAHGWPAGRALVRAAGGGVALGGLFFLWRAVA